MKIVLTGGGTGGHVYPNLAMLPYLKNFEVYYFGSNGIEKELAKKYGVPFYETETVKFERKNLLKNFALPFKLSRCKAQAAKLLEEIKPDVVLSKGGYASLPSTLAALGQDIPVICHESDVSLGLANRVAKLSGATLATAYEETAKKHGGVFTGIPLRRELFKISQSEAKKNLKIYKKIILVLGGSSGAKAINEAIPAVASKLCPDCFIIHVCGKNKKLDFCKDNYLQLEYTDDMATYLNAADVVVSRCGATALHEIAALNKRAVFIPLPKGTSRGDQIENARIALKHGGIILEQEKLSPENLISAISLAKTPMTPICENPNEKLLNLIMEKAK